MDKDKIFATKSTDEVVEDEIVETISVAKYVKIGLDGTIKEENVELPKPKFANKDPKYAHMNIFDFLKGKK